MSSRSNKYMFQYSGLVLLRVPISNAENNRPTFSSDALTLSADALTFASDALTRTL